MFNLTRQSFRLLTSRLLLIVHRRRLLTPLRLTRHLSSSSCHRNPPRRSLTNHRRYHLDRRVNRQIRYNSLTLTLHLCLFLPPLSPLLQMIMGCNPQPRPTPFLSPLLTHKMGRNPRPRQTHPLFNLLPAHHHTPNPPMKLNLPPPMLPHRHHHHIHHQSLLHRIPIHTRCPLALNWV